MPPSSWDGMSRCFFSLLIISAVLQLASCSSYRDHYDSEHGEYTWGEYLILSWSHTAISILPNKNEVKNIVRSFDRAKSRIWVEIYTWTEGESIDALIRAYRRWVDTRVILEGNVYATPRINDDNFKKLKNAGVKVTYADNDRYNFTHAKFWIVDDDYCASTGNLTHSSFQKNRDIIICDTHLEILRVLKALFLADEAKELPVFSESIPLNIAISPINMRTRLISFLQSAKQSLFVYVQSVSDPGILSILQKQYDVGIDVRLCVSDADGIATITGYTFPIAYMRKPYLHAKAIMIDHKDILIGSVNLTSNGIDKNREVVLLYPDYSELTAKIESIFLQDCFPQKFAK